MYRAPTYFDSAYLAHDLNLQCITSRFIPDQLILICIEDIQAELDSIQSPLSE